MDTITELILKTTPSAIRDIQDLLEKRSELRVAQLTEPRRFLFWNLRPSKADLAIAELKAAKLRTSAAQIIFDTIGEDALLPEERKRMEAQLNSLALEITNAARQLRAQYFLAELASYRKLSVRAIDLAADHLLKIAAGE